MTNEEFRLWLAGMIAEEFRKEMDSDGVPAPVLYRGRRGKPIRRPRFESANEAMIYAEDLEMRRQWRRSLR